MTHTADAPTAPVAATPVASAPVASGRDQLVAMARRTLAHAVAGTHPIEPGIVRVPTASYHDPEQWQAEMTRIFRRVPLVLGFSCELRERHAYKALDVMGVPILLSRGDDGVLRSFVNTCSHRGAIVAPEGSGVARRFTCPYHAWSYDSQGALVGIFQREVFGEVDASCMGLTPLPVAERAGLVFGGVTPGAELDIDAWLCGYDEVLAEHHLERCTLVGRQSVAGPNWKLAYDGYLDFYHLPVLHRDSFGPEYSNRAIYDAWGPHQRLTQPDARMMVLDGVPEPDWPTEAMLGGVWTIFPHVSIANFDVGGRLYMVSQLFPGETPGTSVTVQNFLATFEPTDAHRAEIETRMGFLLDVVRDEDYHTGLGIQRAVRTGAKAEFVFGRNEAGGHRFHAWVNRLLAADDSDFGAVMAAAEELHHP